MQQENHKTFIGFIYTWNIYKRVKMFRNCIYIHEIKIQKGPASWFSANDFHCNKICVFYLLRQHMLI